MDAFNSLIQDKGDFVDTLQSNIQLVMGNRVKQMDIAKIEERIAELKKEMIGFVEENARCGADNADFDEHYAKISAELKELQKIKTQYTEQEARQDSFQRRIEDMKKFYIEPLWMLSIPSYRIRGILWTRSSPIFSWSWATGSSRWI